MNHNKKNIISALVFSMLSIIAYLITYNNKVLFFLVFVCERLYSFGAKEELEKSLDDLELEDKMSLLRNMYSSYKKNLLDI